MDGENRGEHHRAVVRALRSLEPLTGPTAAERQRIRDQILLSLEADASETDLPGPTLVRRPNAATANEQDLGMPAADEDTVDVVPEQRGLAEPSAGTRMPASRGQGLTRREQGPSRREQGPGRREQEAGRHEQEAGRREQEAAPRGGKSGSGGSRPASRESSSGTSRPARLESGSGGSRPAGRESGSSTSRPAGRESSSGTSRPAGRESGSGPSGRESGDARPARSRRRGVLAGARGRLAVAALALLALAGSLLGMSVLLARDALPGDALYGIKRTAEAASLGLTFGDEPKALKHLEFASSRISEIETLARRYPNPSDAPVGLYLTALTDFDNDATAGSRQLISLATRSDGRLLESLRDWSAQQSGRLRQVAPQLPEAARNRQAASRALLDRITARADALLARMNCFQTTSGSSDDIGALPATGRCDENNPAPTSSTPQPSVPGTPDNPGSPTGPEVPSTPLPPTQPTPGVPPVPVPGATVPVPAPTDPPTAPTLPTTQPPLIELPPLLPGLPGIGIG